MLQTELFNQTTTTTATPTQPTPDTLSEARQRVRDGMRDGITCPCCEQLVKVYRRRMTATHARILLGLLAAHDAAGGPVKTSAIPLGSGDARTAGGDIGKLELFRLVRRVDGDRWAPSELGRRWAAGERVCADWLDVVNGRIIDRADTHRTIAEALGERFDLARVWQEARQGAQRAAR